MGWIVSRFILRASAFLVGKWFVFWAAGVRLLAAGVKQFFQPRFTSEKIFGLTSDDPLHIVRELGIANFATGTGGIYSLLKPNFVTPIAVVAAIFYGIAGSRHLMDKRRNLKPTTAMVTDLLASLVFVAYLVYSH